MNDSALIEANEPWESWYAKVKLLKPDVRGNSGWCECYVAGLSPSEAVSCAINGERKNEVIACCADDKGQYVLRFD